MHMSILDYYAYMKTCALDTYAYGHSAGREKEVGVGRERCRARDERMDMIKMHVWTCSKN